MVDTNCLKSLGSGPFPSKVTRRLFVAACVVKRAYMTVLSLKVERPCSRRVGRDCCVFLCSQLNLLKLESKPSWWRRGPDPSWQRSIQTTAKTATRGGEAYLPRHLNANLMLIFDSQEKSVTHLQGLPAISPPSLALWEIHSSITPLVSLHFAVPSPSRCAHFPLFALFHNLIPPSSLPPSSLVSFCSSCVV